MKFLTKSVTRCAARIGTLTEFERMPNAIFETPSLLLYTKGGCVPHLTKDVLKMLTLESHLLSVSLPSTVFMTDSIKDVGVSFADFVSMKEHVNFLSVQDPATLTSQGFQRLNAVSVWCRTGRYELTADKYMDIVEAFKPDIYVALSDGDINIESTKKRISKSIARSKNLLEVCLNRHNDSKVLKTKGILGAIEGGYDLEAREEYINYLQDKPLLGFIIDGLHINGPDVKDIPSEQVRNVVKHTVNLLPLEKVRACMGSWNPVTVLDLIELGIDLFDSSFPYVITERSEALTFAYNGETTSKQNNLIVISEKRYADDFSPICDTCECLTCKNHTRAYLHHLHHTKEMLKLVLLMIHNMHHYLQFFKTIREHLKSGTFNEFKQNICLQFDNNHEPISQI